MSHFRNIYCGECRKCVGFKVDDLEGTGPIYCLGCKGAVRKKQEQFEEWAEQYRAAARK